MEQLAAFVGWVDTKDSIINLNTGMMIQAIEDEESGPGVEITLPAGDTQQFFGEDSDAILERAEMFAAIGDQATRVIKANADNIAAQQGVTP